MTALDWVLLALVALCGVLAVRSARKAKRNGKCAGCGGSCAGCVECDKNGEKERWRAPFLVIQLTSAGCIKTHGAAPASAPTR